MPPPQRTEPRRRRWPSLLLASLISLSACADSKSLISPSSYCPQAIRPSKAAADWLIDTPKPAPVLDWLDEITK